MAVSHYGYNSVSGMDKLITNTFIGKSKSTRFNPQVLQP